MWNLIFLAIAACTALPIEARLPSFHTSSEIEELRVEIGDLKHALHTTKVELNLLDERCKKDSAQLNKAKTQQKEGALTAQVLLLEKKVTHLEKKLETVGDDIRTLNASLHQALTKIQTIQTHLLSHDGRLDEVAQLKGTLTSISKAIGARAPTEKTQLQSRSYRVKAGDSLEKIARNEHISIEALRKSNNLTHDKIRVGQELRLPENGS